jgi:uncharacterized iron-regulated membrane protein
MTRHFWVLLHRYAGLYMAFFLIVAGLTGSILAFHSEIDQWLNPEIYDLEIPIQDRPLLDPFALRERALALEPGARCNAIPVQTEPGKIFTLACEAPDHSSKGLSVNLISFKFNPYTGERLPGSHSPNLNTVPNWPLTRKNILFVIYELHFTLLVGDVGKYIFGIAALVWTLDCFVGFYLTLPKRRPKPYSSNANSSARHSGNPCRNDDFFRKGAFKQKTFCQRWQVAWKIKCPSSTQRLNFDLHRAGGLWFWPFLFIFAWSSVMFNLPEFYESIMIQLFDGDPVLPTQSLSQPLIDPNIDFKGGYQIAKRLMAEQAQTKNFKVLNEESFSYDPATGLYSYWAHSDRDPTDNYPETILEFDATSGAFKSLTLMSGEKPYMTISAWLFSLHQAKIWGLPYKILVCALGLVITMLSVTGVVIWWKKRQASKSKPRKVLTEARINIQP